MSDDYDHFEISVMQNSIIKEELDQMLQKKLISEDEYSRDITKLAYDYASQRVCRRLH